VSEGDARGWRAFLTDDDQAVAYRAFRRPLNSTVRRVGFCVGRRCRNPAA
jgi:hypothetical protein